MRLIGGESNMKNTVLILLIIGIVALLSVGVYNVSKSSSTSDGEMKKEDTTMMKDKTAMEPTKAMMKNTDKAMKGDSAMAGKTADARYIPYSASVLERSAGDRRVLFFYASWCPTCRPADADFTKNETKIPEDVTLIRVNYKDPETDQEEKALAQKYGITYQHTFVQIDETGKEITTWNGGQLKELLEHIQ